MTEISITAKSARRALRAGQPVTVYKFGCGGYWCADVKSIRIHRDYRISIVTTTGHKVVRERIEWYRFRTPSTPTTK